MDHLLDSAIQDVWMSGHLDDALYEALCVVQPGSGLSVEYLPKAIEVILSERYDLGLANILFWKFEEVYPGHPACLEAEAKAYACRGHSAGAIQRLEESLTYCIEQFSSWSNLGSLYYAFGAAEELERIHDLSNGYASASEVGFLRLLQLLMDRDIAKVRNRLPTWINLRCQSDRLRLRLSDHLWEAGAREGAGLVVRSVSDSSSVGARSARMRALMVIDPVASQLIGQRLVEEFPRHFLPQYMLALAYWHGRRYDAARLHFEVACKLAPWDAQALVFLGWTELKMGNAVRARTLALETIDLAPAWSYSYSLLAAACRTLGLAEEAKEARAQAKALRKGVPAKG
jgi:tetratricopeptide (TPR) repeat protein